MVERYDALDAAEENDGRNKGCKCRDLLALKQATLEFIHDCSTESVTRVLCGSKELGANEIITQRIWRDWSTFLTGNV